MTNPKPKHVSQGASKRLEALTDGIFAIAATLLVLEIRVPELHDPSTPKMMDALLKVLPSFIAFIFSFLNILVFWLNQDILAKVIDHFDATLTYLNFLFLLFISLIPFTTAFVSSYPFSLISISVYGFLFLLIGIIACITYYYIAFKSNLMHKNIKMHSRRKIWKRVRMGPFLFAIAIVLGWIHVLIPIVIYLMVPFLYLVMPKMEFEEEE